MLNNKPKYDANATNSLIAVAIDKDKASQIALKWALDNLVSKGQVITLVHVNTKGGGGNKDDAGKGFKAPTDQYLKDLFLPFRCFCSRKNVQCEDIVLEDTEIAKAIIEFVAQAAVDKLVVGSASKGGFVRFKVSDIPIAISKGAPDFCTVYVISKGKIQSVRNAVRAPPATSPLRAQVQNQPGLKPASDSPRRSLGTPKEILEGSPDRKSISDLIRSPFSRTGRTNIRAYADLSDSNSDVSFIGSNRPSIDRGFHQPRLSTGSNYLDHSFEGSQYQGPDSYSFGHDYSYQSNTSVSSQPMEDVEAEMKRLKLELKQIMDMYSAACKEALSSQQKARELHRWKMEEEQRLEEARLAEEAALALVERERAKCKAAMEAAEAQQRIAELEAQKRINAEMQALKKVEDRQKAMEYRGHDIRYRKYTIEEIEQATEKFADGRKIGEGGYGPVYRGYLDHTQVAIKVLRPDASQGRMQFQQEIQVLSCIRHPNMVLLLGACPEYGCLVYEYMANGSLEDRLACHGNTPVIPWQHRFRIAAEIATGLLFLHQTKPEPIVHRDLKPGNILLDRNYVSKISDVGLARLVPPTVADTVTQYRMTSTAGTFCYIDPEYQQTGMLGVKSDVYSLGIMLLQIITAKPPMGLMHYVNRSIKKGTFAEMLDPLVPDWPVDEAQKFAALALQCAELRRKDRPDLATVVLPELSRLRALGEDNMNKCALQNIYHSTRESQVSMQDITSHPGYSGYNSSRTSNVSDGRRSIVD